MKRFDKNLRVGRLDISFNNWHWKPEGRGVQHGPQVWPWWRLVSFSLVRMNPDLPLMPPNRRLWIYTRWGALHSDMFWRPAKTKPLV